MWNSFEKRPFFRADMAGLGKYGTGGYGRIGVYRVKLKAGGCASNTILLKMGRLKRQMLARSRVCQACGGERSGERVGGRAAGGGYGFYS